MADRIVVCDDEPFITHAISLKLTKAGFEVVTAANGQLGWKHIEQDPPALVITDLQMPELDGFGLCRLMRQNDQTRNIPVIMLTAKGFEIDHQQVMEELKLTAVMIKPFSPRELLELVQHSLGTAAAVS